MYRFEVETLGKEYESALAALNDIISMRKEAWYPESQVVDEYGDIVVEYYRFYAAGGDEK